MITEAIKVSQQLVSIVPLLGGSTSKADYKAAVELAEYLVEFDPSNPLIDMLTAKIDRYENESPDFAEFNALLASTPPGVSMLRFLMDQHGLTQSDFENEIGQRSLVSRILNGDRNLTVEHMKALAKRFNLPVSMFVNED